MSQNPQEITEAKLAAYIDGELAPEDRAEIEALLGRKPQYRPLLEELRRTRDLLRGLPRETAPAELAEMFNGQLERSVLLGAEGDYHPSRLRTGAWHRVLAAAAIVMLTLGLAAAVYFALPNHRVPLVANTNPSPMIRNTAPPIPDGPVARSSDGSSSDEMEKTDVSKLDAERRSAKPSDSLAEKMSVNAKTGALGMPSVAEANSAVSDANGLDAFAQNISQAPPVQDLLTDRGVMSKAGMPATAPASPDNAVVMVVRASDLRQVRKEMAGYFASNSISWNAAPAHVELALNSSIAQQNASLEQGAGGNSIQNSAAAENLAARDKDSASPYGAGAQNAPSPAQSPDNASNSPMSVNSSARKQEAPATRPASAPLINTQQQVYQGQQVMRRQAMNNGAYANNAYGNSVDSLYVARGLSRQQSRELLECLSRSGEVRQADVYRRASNSPYAQASIVGNSANNAVPQYAGEGTNGTRGGGSGGSYSPRNTTADPHQALATTQSSLSQGLGDNRRVAAPAPAGVEMPSGLAKAGAATRPSDMIVPNAVAPRGAGARSRNMAATQSARDEEFGRTNVTPQAQRPDAEAPKDVSPASAPAQLTDEMQSAPDAPLDVVIVVQKDDAPPADNAVPGAGPAAPATQPLNAPGLAPPTQPSTPPATRQSVPAEH